MNCFLRFIFFLILCMFVSGYGFIHMPVDDRSVRSSGATVIGSCQAPDMCPGDNM